MTSDIKGIIYESPDHGETVFARIVGTLERSKVSETKKAHYLAQWHEWKEILRAAEGNAALTDLINQAEVVYALIKENP